MLTADTKKKIDYLRDVLVGKIPVPSQQIEQITLGLIYKFMSDIDEQNEELGGKSFFSNGYKQYSWKKIMDRSLAGHERVLLYSEGLEKMSRNEKLPQLFRDIFKGAFLPFKDPAVLDLFLKGINEFKYEHSEELGNAFEYLLSTAASQGDAGQFRTPRHIIDFIVEVVDPQKEDKILDPACGTAGFLVSAYKHILKDNTDKKSGRLGSLLTSSERKKLTKNIVGYDISHEMVRLSLVNLYLHGFAEPNIYEYDTLSSLERWDDNFDCLLANPPFMTPRGGIKPHNRFPIQAKKSEVLFVDYITEHLSPNGKAGIIVPEGIIFQSGNAYKQLRKMLVEDGLWAVISLPQGVFNPYSLVKTSILFFNNTIARQTKEIIFVKVENDGYDLGSQRKPIKKDDLPARLDLLKRYRKAVQKNKAFSLSKNELIFASVVKKEKIAANGDFNLSGDRYNQPTQVLNSKWALVELEKVCGVKKGSPITQKKATIGNVPVIAGGQKPAYYHNIANRNGRVITVSASGAYAGFVNFFALPIFASDCTTIQTKDETSILTRFVYYLLKAKQENIYKLQQGGGQPHVYPKDLAKIKVPLPPLEIQDNIVAELDGYQKIIDGARQVIDNYTPLIKIAANWDTIEIESICTLVRGSSPRPQGDPRYYGGKVPRLLISDVTRDGMYVTPTADFLTEEGAKLSRPMKKGEVVMAVSGNPGLPSILKVDACIHDGFVGFRGLSKKVLPEFLYFVFLYQKVVNNSQSIGAIFKNLTTDQIKKFKIPLPPIEVQQRVIGKLKEEQRQIESAKSIIVLFEQKIKDKISEVWGE
ncbi:MAG: N-6 DNA methylase [Patescibacteria group bacterium]|nr:N-6 DNA methylase [Patescibacteria group bacterium]MDD5715635.1 N-6 DNA methylase [Patescibacteria group bacterium]